MLKQCVNLYWPDGKLKRSVHFHENIREGLDQMWNENGILVDSGNYEKGKPVGTHQRWDARGNLIEEITYMEAPRYNYSAWDEKGNLRTETVWLNDQYLERAWDRFQNAWIEKKGIWDGKKIQFEKVPGFQVRPVVFFEGRREDGLTILMEKFPLLGLLYPTWKEEAASFESIKPFSIGSADAVIVYGLGMGAPYFQLKEWLKKDSKRKLIFLEDNTGHLAHFIAHSSHVSLLKDPQVFLEISIEDKYPLEQFEIVSIPSKKKRSLKLELLRKITLAHAISQDRLHGYQPFQNFVQNIRRLPESFYANALKGKFQGIPAIVCGAGPSLQKAIPILKKLSDKAIIIAGGSTLAALSSAGVPIHFGMAIDPNLEEYRRLKNSFAFDTPLLYSTRVHPDVFQTTSGPFGYMRSGIGGILEIWMEEELGLMDPLIGENLSPESISVTTICVAWAQYLGCNSIYLSGVDLAYTNQKRYADGVGVDEKISLEELDLERTAADRILRRKDRMGKPIYTAVRWVMESAALSHFAKKHPEISWYNTTDGGLPIRGIPHVDLDEKLFPQTFPLKKRIAEEIGKIGKEEIVKAKMEELKNSLSRVVACLEILAGKKEGSKVLAELDLQEEMAKDYLFYDSDSLFQGREKWEQFLSLAEKYLVMI